MSDTLPPLHHVKEAHDACAAWLAAAPQAAQPEPPPDTEAVTACWQDFGRTEEFRRAVKWSQDGEIPGALFVAFRAGLRAASPKAAQPEPMSPKSVSGTSEQAQQSEPFEAWFKGYRHGWKSEKDVAADAWQAAIASVLARLEAVPVPGPTHECLRGLRTQQELEALRAAMLAAARGE